MPIELPGVHRAVALLLLALLVSAPPHPAAASASTAEEPLEWLARYLQFDTSNTLTAPPPQQEGAATFLRQTLRGAVPDSRLEVTTFSSPEGRLSLLARLPATSSITPSRAPLLLTHHLDVVPPGDAGAWTQPPFSGAIADGRIWGRGAIDSKGLGIAHLAALAAAARIQHRDRDVLFLAVGDEEAGGLQGTAWLLERHPELFPRASLVLNEGGANRIQIGRLAWWGLEDSQKNPLWLRLSFRGDGGHGSTSGLNPIHPLLRGLARVDELRAEPRLTEPLWRHLKVAAPISGSERNLDFAHSLEMARRVFAELEPKERNRLIPPGYRTVLTDTIQINALDAGNGIANMKPTEASALLDIRLLPDTDIDDFLERLRALFDARVQIEVLLRAETPEPLPPHPDLEILRLTLEDIADAPLVPLFISGTTDSRWFRARGIHAYGFSPFRLEREDTAGIHTVDESLDIDVFLDGVETMKRVVVDLVSGR